MSLSITDLNVWIGDAHILRGITLKVPDGQHVGIIGSSGSGKSMLSLAIMGLLPEGARVEGSIRWDGRELVGASERELRSLRGSQISMMFQDPATSLDPLMRLGKQIALPLRRHRGLRGAALREAIARALAEGCTLDECGATCRSLGEHAPGCTEYVPSEEHEKALEEYAPAGDPEEGASTAEYGIVMLAAVGFAGLLVLILKSDEVRSMLLDIVRNALSIAGNTGLL